MWRIKSSIPSAKISNAWLLYSCGNSLANNSSTEKMISKPPFQTNWDPRCLTRTWVSYKVKKSWILNWDCRRIFKTSFAKSEIKRQKRLTTSLVFSSRIEYSFSTKYWWGVPPRSRSCLCNGITKRIGAILRLKNKRFFDLFAFSFWLFCFEFCTRSKLT